MDTQVKLVLTALNGGISPAERIITLNTDNHLIQVGRASKSVSKGLLGQVDNAWFDSPVMSRDHAEISLRQGNELYITDITSMHGTLLNNAKLTPNSPVLINDGDILVFGAEVRRGPETFPACAFRVNYELIPYKSANTFSFPESSDIEDEEDYDFSDDDMDKQQQSSEDGASIEHSPKLPQPIPSIDLTQDDSPVVDLTGETPAEMRMMGLMAGRPIDIDENADRVSIGVYAGNNPILLDSDDDDDDDAEFSSDSEEQSEDEDSIHSSSSEGYEVNEIQDSDDEGIEDYPMEEDQGLPAINNIIRFGIATDENPSVLLAESSGSAMNDGDDDQSEYGLSEAGAEGIRALFYDGLLHEHSDGFHPTESNADLENGGGKMPHIIEASMSDSVNQTSTIRELSSGFTTCQNSNEFLTSSIRPETSAIRQPSPSDAALVKTAFQYQPPARNGVSSFADFGNSNAIVHSLGEKTGKGAYFDAREANKLRFQAMGNPDMNNITLNQQTVFATSLPPPVAKEIPLEDQEQSRLTSTVNPEDYPSDVPVRVSIKAMNAAAAHFTACTKTTRSTRFGKPDFNVSFSGHSANSFLSESPSSIRGDCAFLDKPDQTPIPDRAPSPLPDMTSAVSYNNSKEHMATAAANNLRSGIKIIDIIDSSSPSSRVNILKRGAESISDATDNELRTWAKYTSGPEDHGDSVPTVGAESQCLVPGSTSDVTTSETADPAPRPTKRLKKFLENVGYAALGGVAVGAGLFSVLVATAPDFL